MALFEKIKSKFVKNTQSDRYLKGFSKSRKSFGDRLQKLSNSFSGINDELLDELMILLLESDVGMDTAQKIVASFEKNKKELKKYGSMQEYLIHILEDFYGQTDQEIRFNENGPTTIMLIGVNGSGKTTTIAKLLSKYKDDFSVMAVAADTFRAGAIEQLANWCERLDVPVVAGKEKSDPASVVVDGLREAKKQDVELVFCDTAGRLQNKKNLMNELAKISRVADREIEGAPQETWLVIDGTTGQNGILQAKEFMDVADITGIVLTKMDGTAKGGIVLAIKDQLGIPVRFLGLGETPADLQPFDLKEYLHAMTSKLDD